MYRDKKVLCIIPARSGSKGLPGKNIKKLLGKPLITYSIEHAMRSKYIDRVIVSTDDSRIAAISLKFGAEVPFFRPKILASDTSCTIDVLLHAIDWLERRERYLFDIIVLLHITAPLRKVEDIDRCIELLVRKNYDNIFSVTESHRNPYFNMIEVCRDGKVKLVKKGNFKTRQAAPQVFDMNASIYVWWKDVLKRKKNTLLRRSGVYVMPKERSVDIDDCIDFKIAEILMKKRFIR